MIYEILGIVTFFTTIIIALYNVVPFLLELTKNRVRENLKKHGLLAVALTMVIINVYIDLFIKVNDPTLGLFVDYGSIFLNAIAIFLSSYAYDVLGLSTFFKDNLKLANEVQYKEYIYMAGSYVIFTIMLRGFFVLLNFSFIDATVFVSIIFL
ncbi:MAG: hypothetical protein J7L47_00930, partial [Candidatus Odinarchaeota archaeon]|nr:hypothetical protein [Candidatus Odinarchaeota archaeon]